MRRTYQLRIIKIKCPPEKNKQRTTKESQPTKQNYNTKTTKAAITTTTQSIDTQQQQQKIRATDRSAHGIIVSDSEPQRTRTFRVYARRCCAIALGGEAFWRKREIAATNQNGTVEGI